MGRPTISVIIIFLNPGRFLSEAIDSILNQTFPDWELLLVDDGSADESSPIAKNYADRHEERVRYLEHPGHENRGMSASRNLGIRHAQGEFLAFLDADDVWLPQKLAANLSDLRRHPHAAMVCGPVTHWYSWDPAAHAGKRDDEVLPLGIEPGIYEPPSLLRIFLRKSQVLPIPSSLLVRHGAVLTVGGFEDSFRGMHEDQAFYAKFCLRHPVMVVEETHALYRQHPASVCNTAARLGKVRAAEFFFFSWLRNYLQEQNFTDPEIRRLVRKGILRGRFPRTMDSLAHVKHRIAAFMAPVKKTAAHACTSWVRSHPSK